MRIAYRTPAGMGFLPEPVLSGTAVSWIAESISAKVKTRLSWVHFEISTFSSKLCLRIRAI
jgi:hypothetical protein